MIALKITHIKQFMNRLLAGEDFDSFLLEEASISTYNTFTIDRAAKPRVLQHGGMGRQRNPPLRLFHLENRTPDLL